MPISKKTFTSKKTIIHLPVRFFSWIQYKLGCGLRVCLLGTSVDNNHMAPNSTIIIIVQIILDVL